MLGQCDVDGLAGFVENCSVVPVPEILTPVCFFGYVTLQSDSLPREERTLRRHHHHCRFRESFWLQRHTHTQHKIDNSVNIIQLFKNSQHIQSANQRFTVSPIM